MSKRAAAYSVISEMQVQRDTRNIKGKIVKRRERNRLAARSRLMIDGGTAVSH
jgi:hypothetical protein